MRKSTMAAGHAGFALDRGAMSPAHALAALAGLGQATRLEIFRVLMRSEPQGLAAGSIAERLGCPQNTLSTHIGILARSGLVVGTRSGRSVIYRANAEGDEVSDRISRKGLLQRPSRAVLPPGGLRSAGLRSIRPKAKDQTDGEGKKLKGGNAILASLNLIHVGCRAFLPDIPPQRRRRGPGDVLFDHHGPSPPLGPRHGQSTAIAAPKP